MEKTAPPAYTKSTPPVTKVLNGDELLKLHTEAENETLGNIIMKDAKLSKEEKLGLGRALMGYPFKARSLFLFSLQI